MMAKRKKDVFDDMSNAAVGIGTVGISTAVGSKMAAQAPAGSPNLTSGFGTIAGFTGIGVTAVGGKSVLGMVKKLNKRRK